MESRTHKKVQIGIVTSTKMDKTISVKVERRLPHPIYQKYFTQSQKFMAHDPENTCNEGDRVKIIECRPLSANKRWRLLEVIERKA